MSSDEGQRTEISAMWPQKEQIKSLSSGYWHEFPDYSGKGPEASIGNQSWSKWPRWSLTLGWHRTLWKVIAAWGKRFSSIPRSLSYPKPKVITGGKS
jgi:hypothetical protein